jgi:hypothetical protein
MAQVISLREIHRERRRRSEKQNLEKCVELLEWNIKTSVDAYFLSPPEERLMRAT